MKSNCEKENVSIISSVEYKSTVIMIRYSITIAVLVFILYLLDFLITSVCITNINVNSTS